MKKLILSIGLSICTISAIAQTNDTIIGGLGKIGNAFLSDIPTNFGVYTFGLYAPQAPKGEQWGGGMFMAWNFSQNVGAGMGIEAIGTSFWMPSAQLQLKLPLHPLAFLGGGFTNVLLTLYGDAGAAAPLGGSANGASTIASIAGGGGYIDIVSVLGGKLGVGGGYNYWGGAGAFSGDHYHGGLVWHKGF